MESHKLTDEELIKLAQEKTEADDSDNLDIGYYQERFNLYDGIEPVYIGHLYFHYERWSSDPVSCPIFKDMLKLSVKTSDYVYVDKDKTEINLEALVGEYVETKRKRQKEERLRKISSSKSKTKRKDSV